MSLLILMSYIEKLISGDDDLKDLLLVATERITADESLLQQGRELLLLHKKILLEVHEQEEEQKQKNEEREQYQKILLEKREVYKSSLNLEVQIKSLDVDNLFESQSKHEQETVEQEIAKLDRKIAAKAELYQRMEKRSIVQELRDVQRRHKMMAAKVERTRVDYLAMLRMRNWKLSEQIDLRNNRIVTIIAEGKKSNEWQLQQQSAVSGRESDQSTPLSQSMQMADFKKFMKIFAAKQSTITGMTILEASMTEYQMSSRSIGHSSEKPVSLLEAESTSVLKQTEKPLHRARKQVSFAFPNDFENQLDCITLPMKEPTTKSPKSRLSESTQMDPLTGRVHDKSGALFKPPLISHTRQVAAIPMEKQSANTSNNVNINSASVKLSERSSNERLRMQNVINYMLANTSDDEESIIAITDTISIESQTQRKNNPERLNLRDNDNSNNMPNDDDMESVSFGDGIDDTQEYKFDSSDNEQRSVHTDNFL